MRLGIAFLAWMAVLAGTAGASPTHLSQQLFDPHGDPLVALTLAREGIDRVTWRICRPHRACTRAPARTIEPDEGVLTPGRMPAGTTFVARIIYRGRLNVIRTDTWHGRVRAVSPARLIGHVHPGATVRAAPARWRGGWGREHEDLRLEVCRHPTSGCQTLSAPKYAPSDAAGIRVPTRFRGWYLHAADVRVAHDTAEPSIAYGSPASVPVTHRSALVSWSRPVRIA